MAYKTNPRYDDIGERRGYLVQEVASLYRLSCQTVYNEINAGRLKTFTAGKRRIVPVSALEEWEGVNQS